ncbi:Rubisco LS methyltransferase, substrate-binding domain [Ostreococcus tauri]|uniref:Rubisco LS methyltransferase, substrate-binding domain n=2 Tax=Ostreococcus tauri TaxID=70448 RepID=A0A096P8P8_OSTTA|nr:Rubisco LS methyltransferase, substrate-binding domain [Ostreococcus tauri]CEG00366.1 Rubisco LS methyltransferase, substrate-binding domain [Ostreococcus tauri]|eukprot:XP_003083608.2 Rubisco LS methyltransferase, substrate-binding domain [Ostreococcus tauri]
MALARAVVCAIVVMAMRARAMPDAKDEAFVAWLDAGAVVDDGSTGDGGRFVYAAIEDEDGTGGGRRRGVFARESGTGGTIARVREERAVRARGTTATVSNESAEWALAIELAMEREKGVASRYRPFVDSLYERTPANSTVVSKKARERLAEHHAEKVMRRYDEDIVRGWNAAVRTFRTFPTIFRAQDFTRSKFEEALAIVRANSFEVTRADGVRERVLVPLAHLLVHDTSSSVPCVKMVDDTFVINVDEHRAGDELSCSHGEYSDAETFARFGTSAVYSEENNARDVITFTFPDEVHLKEEIGSCGPAEDIGFTRDGASAELMCALRLVSANATEWSEMRKPNFDLQSLKNRPLSEESEVAVYDALFATLTDLLNSYPYSDVDDEHLLRGDRLADDERRAVKIRLREKRSALRALNTVQYRGRKALGGVLFDKHFSHIMPTRVKDEL